MRHFPLQGNTSMGSLDNSVLSPNYRQRTEKNNTPCKSRCVIGALEETRTPDLLIRRNYLQKIYKIAIYRHLSYNNSLNFMSKGDIL